jgi:hypothetical protein
MRFRTEDASERGRPADGAAIAAGAVGDDVGTGFIATA